MPRSGKAKKEEWEQPSTTGEMIGSIASRLRFRIDRERYEEHPDQYLELFGHVPWSKQKDIIKSVRDNKITLVRSCNDVGKTHVVGQIFWWWMDIYRPQGTETKTKVITSAKSFDSLKFMLWTRIREMYKHVAPRFSHAQINLTDYQPDPHGFPEWFGVGYNPRIEGDEATAFQGHHGEHVLFILEEAITMSPAIFKAIEGSMLDEGSRLLVVYNPTTTLGSEVYQMERDNIGKLITISCEDLWASPEYIADPSRYKQLVSKEGAKDLIKKYGRNHPVCKARLFGEWADQDDEAAISKQALKKAFERYKDTDYNYGVVYKIIYGWDIAGDGVDDNVLYRILYADYEDYYKNPHKYEKMLHKKMMLFCERMESWQGTHADSLQRVYKRVHDDIREFSEYNDEFYDDYDLHDTDKVELTAIMVPDAIGEGSHVYSLFEAWDVDNNLLEVFPFKGGEKAERVEERKEVAISNKISEAWYRTSLCLTELIPDFPQLVIEYNTALEEELTMRKYEFVMSKKEPMVWQVEPKKEFKKRNRNKSPDHADALIMGIFGYFYENAHMPRIGSV